MGLKDSGQIGGIKVHPFNTNTVWLAALGSPFGPNDERGIFKTTDGGKTWKKTLFVNNETGGRDIEVDWENPDILYAAMYRGFRKGWDIISGGPAERRRHLQVDRRRRDVEEDQRRPARQVDRQDRHRHRAQQSEGALRDGRSAGQRRRPLPLERRRRIVDARQQQPAPARAAVLLPLRRRSTRRTRTKCGSTSSASTSPPTAARRSRRSRRRTATTTACGSTPTTRTSSCRSTTAAPTSA